MPGRSEEEIPRFRFPCPNFSSCGRKRRDGDVFCSKCYFKLPRKLQLGLWNTKLNNMASHVAICMEFLNPHDEREDK
jgi:hypothetical protein